MGNFLKKLSLKQILICLFWVCVSALVAFRLIGQPADSFIAAFSAYLVVLAAAVIDFKTHKIPNILPLALCILRILISVILSLLGRTEWSELVGYLIGGIIMLLILLLAGKIAKGGIGGGDVKLLSALTFVCGLYIGTYTLLLALLLTLVWFGVRRLRNIGTPKDRIPFGPFICIGYASVCILHLF